MKTSQAFFVGGIVLAAIATIANILAFALPSWIYTYDSQSKSKPGIENAGLWTFCLDAFFDYSLRATSRGNSGTRDCFNDCVPMYGCHWIYSEELKEIRWTVFNPLWYIVVQIMATVNLILSLLSLIGLFFICLVKKNKCPLIFGITSQFLCVILGLCEVVLYAIRVKDEEYYQVINVRTRSLGAGWGMAFVAFVVAGLSMIALVISYVFDDERKAARALKKANRAHSEQQGFIAR